MAHQNDEPAFPECLDEFRPLQLRLESLTLRVRLTRGKQENGDCDSRQGAEANSNLRSVHGCDISQNRRGPTARDANSTDPSPAWICPRRPDPNQRLEAGRDRRGLQPSNGSVAHDLPIGGAIGLLFSQIRSAEPKATPLGTPKRRTKRLSLALRHGQYFL